jgi:hypothetical protein
MAHAENRGVDEPFVEVRGNEQQVDRGQANPYHHTLRTWSRQRGLLAPAFGAGTVRLARGSSWGHAPMVTPRTRFAQDLGGGGW